MGAPAARHPPGGVEHGRARPRHALHHHQPKRFAGHVDSVAQGVGAEQGGAWVVAENIDQRSRIDRVDVLREQRQSGPRQAVGDPCVHALEARNRGEQTERPAGRGFDQARIGAGERSDVARPHIGDDQHLGRGGIIERTLGFEVAGGRGQMDGAGARFGRGPALAGAQRRRSDQHAVGLTQNRRRHGLVGSSQRR